MTNRTNQAISETAVPVELGKATAADQSAAPSADLTQLGDTPAAILRSPSTSRTTARDALAGPRRAPTRRSRRA